MLTSGAPNSSPTPSPSPSPPPPPRPGCTPCTSGCIVGRPDGGAIRCPFAAAVDDASAAASKEIKWRLKSLRQTRRSRTRIDFLSFSRPRARRRVRPPTRSSTRLPVRPPADPPALAAALASAHSSDRPSVSGRYIYNCDRSMGVRSLSRRPRAQNDDREPARPPARPPARSPAGPPDRPSDRPNARSPTRPPPAGR